MEKSNDTGNVPVARKLRTMPPAPALPAPIPLLGRMERVRESLVRTRIPGDPVPRHPVMLARAANKPESHMTAMEKMDIVRLGVSKNDLENLKEIAALDYEELSRALSVTRATLINKKGEDKFSATLSERIVGLADIYSYGYGVFEDEDRFNKWMFRPNQALAGKAPYELVDNQFGREEVRNIIGRIEYGVYS